jgi:hypothetical protein
MRPRALIIRSDHDELPGGANNAECMSQLLHARGFDIIPCLGAAASREGILVAYKELIADTTADDAVVVYFTGHGGRAINSRYAPNSDLPRYVQLICPTDYANTRDDQFYGISNFELSLLLAALTEKTTNATVILECCFAAQLSRGDESDPAYATPPVLTRVALTNHLESLREQSNNFSAVALTGNPNAIRVAACGQVEQAYRVDLPYDQDLRKLGINCSRFDELIGAMTLGLIQTLVDAGDRPIPWRSLAPVLRARLHVQRPEIEGPTARVPFSLATNDATTFAIRKDGDGAFIEAGTLLGVSAGDVYGVMPAGCQEIDRDRLYACITIDEVTTNRSRGRRIDWKNDHREFPPDCVALAMQLALERYPVRIDANPTIRPAIEVELRTSNRVRAATEADSDILGELRVHDGLIELRDALGPLFPPAPYPQRLRDAVLDIGNLATERRLHALSDDGSIDLTKVSVSLGVIEAGGVFRPIADHGTPLALSDRIALRLVNTSDSVLFANVFNIGLRRRISLLSGVAASGVALPPNSPVYIGDSIDGRLVGFGLGWPESLARDRPRMDTAMVMLTASDTDLRVLESDEHLARGKGAMTPLQQLLMQLATGQPRGSESRGVLKNEPFAIIWRDYQLFPIDASLDIGTPEIDASPPNSRVARSEAVKLRIRLDTMRPITPSTRTDVLVCARSSQSPFQATTFTGELRDAVIYEGEIRDAADVYIWTSEDRGDRRSLADLLAMRPIVDPTTILRAPDDDPRVLLSPGASLQLASLARVSLRVVSPGVVTAFRGSFGSDNLGLQRYCASAMRFGLAIERGA